MCVYNVCGNTARSMVLPNQLVHTCREIATLRAKAQLFRSVSCTKASVLHTFNNQDCQLPSTVRLIVWTEVKKSKSRNFIGKGAFAKCFVAQMASLKVCLKILYAGTKYKSLLVRESRILSELCHFNLPWIHGFCDDSGHTAIIMTFHAYCGRDTSLHIYAALHDAKARRDLNRNNWEQILIGCVSALCYLQTKNILHNDIKSDNILIEKMAPTFSVIRAVLVDFNKACYLNEAQLYKLSTAEKIKYTKDHPQIAPEVRNGYQNQSFASDVYSMGRIILKINIAILDVPQICSMAELCLSSDSSKCPNAETLKTSLSSQQEKVEKDII